MVTMILCFIARHRKIISASIVLIQFLNISIFLFLYTALYVASCWWLNFLFFRQHDKLSKVTSATGYKEKVPEHIQQENVAKLASLMQEILSLEEARQHIEAQANNNHD